MRKTQILLLGCLLCYAPMLPADVRFVRSDANADGSVSVADAIFTVAHLFQNGPAPCLDALDANDSGGVDITDALHTVIRLFGAGAPPPPPFPACGNDPTLDVLGCASFEACSAIATGPQYGAYSYEMTVSGNGSYEAGEIEVADFNGDGVQDVMITNPPSQPRVIPAIVRLGTTEGQFGPAQPYFEDDLQHFVDLGLGDFDDDGFLDAVFCNVLGFRILAGGTGGAFTPVLPASTQDCGTKVQVADLNGDGLDDFVGWTSATTSQWFRAYTSNGDFTFTLSYLVQINGSQANSEFELVDYDNNGLVDVALSAGGALLRFGSGNGTFHFGFIRGDADSDGDVDIDDHTLIDSFVMGTTPSLGCSKSADVNDDGVVTAADATMLLDYLNDPVLNPPPLPPFPGCGPDSTPDTLSCGAQTPTCQNKVGSHSHTVTIEVADITGDGVEDIILANVVFGPALHVYVGTGNAVSPFFASTPMTYDLQDTPTGDDPRVSSIATADMDGDLDPDVVVSSEGLDTLTVFLNDGIGNLTRVATTPSGTVVTHEAPRSLHLVDVDGDGDNDAIHVAGKSLEIHKNSGTGLAGPIVYATGDAPGSLALTDLNNDTHLDLVITNENDDNLSIRLGVGDGTFGAETLVATGTGPKALSAGFINGDSNIDLAYGLASGHELRYGNGDGTFQAATSELSSTLVDIDGDGDLDLYRLSGLDLVFERNDGTGTFGAVESYTMPHSFFSVDFADLNSDGNLDVVIAHNNDTSTLLHSGDNGFELMFPTSQRVVPALDFDHAMAHLADVNEDGWIDMVSISRSSNNPGALHRYLGIGSGLFTAAISQELSPLGFWKQPRYSRLADINGDCHIDVLFLNDDSTFGIVYGDGAGNFAPAEFYPGHAPPVFAQAASQTSGSTQVAVGDLNSDGFLDLATLGTLNDSVMILLHTGP